MPERSYSAWDRIVDREWRVLSIDGTPVIRGSEIFITFGSDGVMTGEAQNRFHAGYEVDGSSISIEPVAVTRLYFDEPEGAMEQEGRLFVVLQDVVTWEERLVLRTEDGRLVEMGVR